MPLKKITTPKELKEKLEKIVEENNDDPENMHGAMDELLADVLIELGYKEAIEFYNNQEVWYS